MMTYEEFYTALDIIIHSNVYLFIVASVIVLFSMYFAFHSFVYSLKRIIYRSEPPTKVKKGLNSDEMNNGSDVDA